MIDWFARNPVAANLLMFAIIIAGLSSASRSIPVEVFPSFANDTVAIATVFRGATPNSVEDSVTNRVEEAIYDIEGISETISSSSEGYSLVRAEIQSGYDRREILNKVKLRVDALSTLPNDTENPVVSLIETYQAVMQVAVMGDVDEKTLRLHADKVREDLLSNDQISLVDLIGVNNYEIGIELAPETLEKYDITLASVTQAIQRGSADVSAGNVQTRDGDILIRADGQAYSRIDFAEIPIISQLGSDPILLGNIATITDGFEEQPLITKFNNKPAILMDITRTGSQSAVEIADTVKQYIDSENKNSINSFELAYYDDDSQLIKSRLSTLIKSGIQGGILVLLLLSLFLRPAIAFWVFLGIPISFMGAFIVMPWIGGSFNMMSLFAFIVVLGIVVDDAIVTGENIYRKMRDGLAPLEASIVGTKQIAIPVTFGILTTIVAFIPLFNMGNNRIGHLAAQIPMVVIPVLIFSLIESKFVLPAHLSHIKPRTESEKSGWLARTQMSISRGFEDAILKHYQPFLEKSLRNKSICLTALLAVSAIVIAFAVNGHTKFTFFPRVESEEIKVSLTMPDTTGFEITQAHINTIANHLTNLQNKYRDPDSGVSVIKHIYSTAGGRNQTVKSSIGYISAELYGPEDRALPVRTSQIARELRNLVGDIPGAEELSIVSSLGRRGSPIDIEISGADLADMRTVGEKLRMQLQRYPSVYDIQDTFSGGKEELNIELKSKARILGLDLVTVASQIRGSIFGFEAQRLQRGREEVRVMVRLPLEYRSSMQDLMDLPIQIGTGLDPLPLSDLATITPQRSSNTLYKVNRQSIINVSSDVDKDTADVPAILRDLTVFLESQKELFPQLTYVFRGEAEEQSENNQGLLSGVFLIIICVYALLAIPFKSYSQPLIVMSIMPVSVVSAVLGHIVVGYNLSMLSVVGFVALLGVVVNDSLVLVDYINQQRKRGMDVFDAVLTSGTVRFRPVILTSLTTFAGLTPLLLDSATQSQFLKPMAISLGFGILFSTIVTLIIVPVNYLLAYQSKQQAKIIWAKWLEFWNREDVHP